MLALLGPIGPTELIIIAFIIIVVFGVGRLPEVGGAIGRSIREFRKATKEPEQTEVSTTGESASTSQAAPGTCPSCGTQNEQDAKFCAQCGADLRAAVK